MKFTYKHTLYASYIGYITQAIINNLSPLLFVTFQREFNISLEQIGFLISLNFAVQITVDLISARYVDKIGYRISAVLAHIAATLGLICMGILPVIMSNAYIGLIIATIINSIGGGIIEVIISPIVESLPGDEKESAMSLLHSFYCWGHVAVVLLSTAFFYTVGIKSWHFLPILWAFVPLFNAFYFYKVPLRVLVQEHERTPVVKLFTSKVFWILFILMIIAGASELAMSQWSSYFAETGLSVSKTMGDLMGPCTFAILMGLSRTFYGMRGSKFNLLKALTINSLLCIASYMLAVFAPVPLLSLIGCALTGLFVGIMWPGVFSLSARSYPQGGTAMFAVLAFAGDLGCSLGPGIVGLISSSSNLKVGLLAAASFPFIMLLGTVLNNRLLSDK